MNLTEKQQQDFFRKHGITVQEYLAGVTIKTNAGIRSRRRWSKDNQKYIDVFSLEWSCEHCNKPYSSHEIHSTAELSWWTNRINNYPSYRECAECYALRARKGETSNEPS